MLKQVRQFSLVELLTNLGVPNADIFFKEISASGEASTTIYLQNGKMEYLYTYNYDLTYKGKVIKVDEFLNQNGGLVLVLGSDNFLLSNGDLSVHLQLPGGAEIALCKQEGFFLSDYPEGAESRYRFKTLLPVYASLVYDDSGNSAAIFLRAALAPFFTEE